MKCWRLPHLCQLGAGYTTDDCPATPPDALAEIWCNSTPPSLIPAAMAFGHLMLFVTRTEGHFWLRPWPVPIMVWPAAVIKRTAILPVAYGFGPITWPEIALVWGYSSRVIVAF